MRQTGGKGQYGHVVFELEPQRTGQGFEFVDATAGGVDPEGIHPSRSTRASRTRCRTGVLAGYPVIDVKVTLLDGSFHEVDSSESRSRSRRSLGFKDGCRKANPVLLEPIMEVEVVTPKSTWATSSATCSARRGVMEGMDDMPRRGKIVAPRADGGDVRLLDGSCVPQTQGRATFTMEFKHYSEAPKNVADAIITARERSKLFRSSAGCRLLPVAGEQHHRKP